ncbi:Cotton fiber protein [Quillaja saponaria]|uniref:Cotton fiber protein n=1 Tax=Quillaja saponaria TaxID=32244 RepID=A0AAD7PGK9_QUISA|nr:Cotton fiber protein [Quillaja saponaria]
MHRKRSPIFQKVSNLLKFSILIPKLRKPSIPKLLLLKQSRKFKLVKHYNNGFLGQYQFSPSNTPLIHYHRKQFKNRSFRDLYSLLFLCRCLGDGREYQLDALPLPAIENGNGGELFKQFDSGDEEESVDQRAEKFIEKFYQEMIMQRRESI